MMFTIDTPRVPAARPAASQPAVTPAPTASALGFDLKVGGQNAAAAARQCIATDRRVQFGASLLYDGKTGRSRKVYFAATPMLQKPSSSLSGSVSHCSLIPGSSLQALVARRRPYEK